VADRVILHVGAPKTGTSYLQDRLFHNPEVLATQGILYPADRADAQFLAALDLMQLTWGGLEKQAGGAWERLAEAVRGWSGTAIVSHEILGFASRAHVHRALESLVAPVAGPRCTWSCPHATSPGRSRPSGRRTSSTGDS
jgi:hypothetical protein